MVGARAIGFMAGMTLAGASQAELSGSAAVFEYADKTAFLQSVDSALRQVDLEDLQPGAYAQTTSRGVELYGFIQPFAAVTVESDAQAHLEYFGVRGSSPTALNAGLDFGIRLPRPVSAVGFFLRSEACLDTPAPFNWRLLDAAGNEVALGSVVLDEGCPGTPHVVYFGLRSSAAFSSAEFHRFGVVFRVDDLAFPAPDIDFGTVPGERVVADFDELVAPSAAPFESGGLSFQGNAQVWDQLFGLTHAQAFQGMGTEPNFLLTNLDVIARGGFQADGIEMLLRSACGEAAAVNVETLDNQGKQQDYLSAVLGDSGGPALFQLSRLRPFYGIRMRGGESGALCNLAIDDLALIRTQLYADDFEDRWPLSRKE